MSDLLRPAADEDSAPFWAACARGELRIQRCTGCGRLRFPPRPLCPWCHSFDHDWARMDGTGTIWSFAVPHPPLLAAYAAVAPYSVIVVALDDDPSIRLVGNLVTSADDALDAVDPATIEIGEPVAVVFAAIDAPPAAPPDATAPARSPSAPLAMPRWIRRPP